MVFDNESQVEIYDIRDLLLKVRFKLLQSTKQEVRHFLLEKYLDSEFIHVQKLISFESKLKCNSQKDYKLARIEKEETGIVYFEK